MFCSKKHFNELERVSSVYLVTIIVYQFVSVKKMLNNIVVSKVLYLFECTSLYFRMYLAFSLFLFLLSLRHFINIWKCRLSLELLSEDCEIKGLLFLVSEGVTSLKLLVWTYLPIWFQTVFSSLLRQ